ncbi:MAG: hypothetical protein ACRELG_02410 [Gemmataceae bacterium]
MPGPEPILFPALSVFRALMWGGSWAYGPAPGVELIPYFLGLAAWAGLAFLAILLAPFSALLRRFRGGKSAPPSEPKTEEPAEKTEPRP